jgi:hypothetical protein
MARVDYGNVSECFIARHENSYNDYMVLLTSSVNCCIDESGAIYPGVISWSDILE